MAVYTFSVPDKNEQLNAEITKAKVLCTKKHLNFSSVVAKLVKEWAENEARKTTDIS